MDCTVEKEKNIKASLVVGTWTHLADMERDRCVAERYSNFLESGELIYSASLRSRRPAPYHELFSSSLGSMYHGGNFYNSILLVLEVIR
jgi:hypothetical protein